VQLGEDSRVGSDENYSRGVSSFGGMRLSKPTVVF
jgi:hypothetical protein